MELYMNRALNRCDLSLWEIRGVGKWNASLPSFRHCMAVKWYLLY